MEILVNKEILKKIKTVEFKKDFTWHYLYICHHIKTYKFVNVKFEDSEYVPVNMKTLRKHISYDNASKLMKNLIELKIIETDGSFKTGLKSKYYKISDRYSDKQWFLSKIQDEKLFKKLSNLKTDDLSHLNTPYGILASNLNKTVLDEVKSVEYVQSNVTDDSKKLNYTYSIKNFKKTYTTVSDKTGRVFNNLTNLPTELRKFLTVDGNPLYQVDIKCSQPTFLGLYLLKNNLCDYEEVVRFLKDCQTGVLYDKLADFSDRKTVKKEIFRKVFFNKNYPTKNNLEVTFEEKYPTIFKQIKELKKQDYKDLAVMLQSVESQLIMEVVMDVECFVLTIHDSLLTTEDCIIDVKEKLENKFFEKYGFEPELSIEKC